MDPVVADFEAEYRVLETAEGFEPQMSYLVRGVVRWFPLNREGRWADPDGWNDEAITVRLVMKDKAMAERSIVLARAINGTNIRPLAGNLEK